MMIMNSLKIAGLALLSGVALVVAEAPAVAQDQTPAPAAAAQPSRQLTLDQVLAAVRRERTESSAENRQREERFLRERNSQ